MDCEEVCILQQGDEVVLQCFMQCLNGSRGPPRNITHILLCVSQFLRVDNVFFLVTPPLPDADMLDHPGINTGILNIFNIFNICTINSIIYSVQCIFNVFDMECMYFIYQTKGALGMQRVLWSSDNGGSPTALEFKGTTSSPGASFVPGPVVQQRCFMVSSFGATLYPF